MRPRVFLAILCLLAGCVTIDPPVPTPIPVPVPTPTPTPVPAPTGKLDFSAVAKLIATADKNTARDYAAGWQGLAWALERGELVGQPIQTTGELRALLAAYETLNWQGTPVVGFCPGISAAINAALLESLGNEDRPLQAGEATRVIKALAEACHR